ncbi:MAG: ABC transporter ATP-binding protein [Prevotella sp.]|nr:ABC transporter ATP-binding protein [Prevotella sp.]
MRYLRWLWHNTLGVRGNIFLRIIVGVGQVSLALLMVWLCRYFIDVAIRGTSSEVLVTTICELVLVVAGNIALRQLYFYMTIRATAYQSNAVRLRIFGHLLRRRIYDDAPLHSGDITSRLETDVSAISEAVAGTLPQLVVTTAKLTGAFVLLYSMDRQLAWMLLLSTPFLVVMGKLFAFRLRTMTHDVRQQDSRIQMLVQEGMEHNAMLRVMESGSWLTSQLDGMQQGLLSKIERRTRFTLAARTVMAVCFGFGYLLAFVWGGLQLRDGVITFGVMTAFLQLVAQIQHPILDLLNMVPQLIHASASVDRLEELEGKDAEQEMLHTRLLTDRLGVSVKGVSYRYQQDKRQVLREFSHDFLPGSRTALMGETGAGKTTLFRMMLALITPQEGGIEVYDSQEWVPVASETRRNFVFVPQGNTLMSGTVRYNLQLACPQATEEEMRHVLHVAVADFVFDLPQGLDTPCGERGMGFSEGQAQRIAIARGLLRPGGVLLLDEISASLDEQTERELFTRLFAAYADKTIILITHRSTVAQLCDAVVRIPRLSD